MARINVSIVAFPIGRQRFRNDGGGQFGRHNLPPKRVSIPRLRLSRCDCGKNNANSPEARVLPDYNDRYHVASQENSDPTSCYPGAVSMRSFSFDSHMDIPVQPHQISACRGSDGPDVQHWQPVVFSSRFPCRFAHYDVHIERTVIDQHTLTYSFYQQQQII